MPEVAIGTGAVSEANSKPFKALMVWGWMAASGVRRLHLIEGIKDKNEYLDILKSNVKARARKLDSADNFKFYRNHDPKHTSLLVKNWLLDYCPDIIKTPAQSPDSNVIEHIWDELGHRVQYRGWTNKGELKIVLGEEWNKIGANGCTKFGFSMPKKLQAVIPQKGFATKY